MEQSRKPATPGSWKPGQSGNPNGRKSTGESVAAAVRAKYPPDTFVELVGKLAETASSEQVRLGALQLLAERGYGKVTTTIDAAITNGGMPAHDWSRLPLERRREILAELEAAKAESATNGDSDDA